jgi:prepilin-type N-terminal cleavage/methylation domain-containing protein
MRKSSLPSSKGFTIIEVMVVISIISILSFTIIPVYKGYIEKSKATKAVTIGQSICSAAIWSYKDQKGTISPSRVKTDIESITATSIQEVAFINNNSKMQLHFSVNSRNYVIDLDISSRAYIIKEREKGTVIYE